MANEILVTTLMQFSKGGYSDEVGSSSQQIDMDGTHFIHNKLTVTTAAVAIPLGSVSASAVGVCWAKNHDPTNFIELRNGATGADVIKLKPGEQWPFRWPADAVPYAIADTASCELEYLIIED